MAEKVGFTLVAIGLLCFGLGALFPPQAREVIVSAGGVAFGFLAVVAIVDVWRG